MISTAIITSEREAVELEKLLQRYCADLLTIIGIYNSYKDAIPKLIASCPDCIFADTNLCDEDGFDCLEKLNFLDTEYIFMGQDTAEVVRSFKFSPLDFLLKPIDPLHMRRAVEKCIKKLEQKRKMTLNASTQNVRHLTSSNKLMIHTQEGIIMIHLDDIIYIEADRSYSIFQLKNGQRHIVSHPLRVWSEILTDRGFFLVHKSHLININEVKLFLKKEGGAVVMSNGHSIYVARRRKDALLEKLKQLTFHPPTNDVDL